MIKDFPGEKWKKVEFDFDFTNESSLKISNYGRLQTSHKNKEPHILKGSTINGYQIIRLKLFKPRLQKTEAAIKRLQKPVAALTKEIKELSKVRGQKKLVEEKTKLLKAAKKDLAKIYKEDQKYRTINYHSLIHRLVATYFLPASKTGQTKVGHLDFNKVNNRVANLKWMTPEENFRHQQNSPHVIQVKEERKLGNHSHKTAKLTVTKVMLLKKLLNQNKPVKQLIKQFKVTDMQIYRIKRGENWGYVPAAE